MPGLQYTPGGCIIVHTCTCKLTACLQYTSGSCKKGVANVQSDRTLAMASCKCLSHANAKQLRVVQVEKLFQVGSCRTAQGGHKEKPLLVPAEITIGGEQETKRFVQAKKTPWTNHGSPSTVDLYDQCPLVRLLSRTPCTVGLHTCTCTFIRMGSKGKWTNNNNYNIEIKRQPLINSVPLINSGL